MALRELTIDIGFQIDSHPLVAADQATDAFKSKILSSEADAHKLGAAIEGVGAGAASGLGTASAAAVSFGATASQAGMQVGASIGSAVDSASSLGAQVDTTKGRFTQLREAGVQAATALKQAYAEHKEQIEEIGKTLKENRALIAGVFGATAGTIGLSVRTAANFEAAMSRVGAISRASEEELALLSRTAQELGATTVFSASQAAEGMTFLAMAGFDVNETIAAMPGLLSTAAAAKADLGTTADIVSNILSGFNLQAEEAGRVADVLTATFTSSNTTLQSLGATMSYVAPVAASLGVEIEDVAALAGMLGDVGIQGERAGTALRAAMTRLAAPTGEAANLIRELGIQTADSSGNLLPFTDIIRQIEERTRGMGSAQRAAVVSTLVGVEAASAFTSILELGADHIATYADTLRRSAGIADDVAARQLDNLHGAFTLLGSAIEGAQIAIGSRFVPIIRFAAESLTRIVDIFNSLPGPLQTVIAAGLAFTAMLSGAALAASFIIPQLGTIGRGLALMRTGFLTVGRVIPFLTAGVAKLGVTLNLSFWPVTLTIAGIVASILILQDVFTYLRGEGDSLTGRVVAWGKEWIGGLAQPIVTAFGRVQDFVGRTVMGIRNLGGVIADMPGRIARWFIGGFQAGLQWLLGLPGRTIEVLGAWLSSIRDWFASTFNLGDAIAAGIERAMEWIPAPLRGIADRIMSFLPQSPAEEGPLSRLDHVGPGLVGTLADSIAAADTAPITDAMSGLVGGMAVHGTMAMDEGGLTQAAAPIYRTANGPSVQITVNVDARGAGSDDAEQIGETTADRIRQVIEEFVAADWYAVALEDV